MGKRNIITIFLATVCFGVGLPLAGFSQSQKIDSLMRKLLACQGVMRCDIFYQLAYEYIDVDNEKAIIFGDSSLRLACIHHDSLGIVKANRIKGAALRRLERIDEALATFSEVLPIATRNGFRQELKYIYNGLGMIHFNRGEYDRPLSAHFKSLLLRQSEVGQGEMSISYVNIGTVYYKLGNIGKL